MNKEELTNLLNNIKQMIDERKDTVESLEKLLTIPCNNTKNGKLFTEKQIKAMIKSEQSILQSFEQFYVLLSKNLNDLEDKNESK